LIILDIMIRTKTIKPNIEKYIFLHSDHARKTNYTDTNNVEKTLNYDWRLLQPLEINEQATLELFQKNYSGYSEEVATGVITVTSATTANVTILNPRTNGLYLTSPTATLQNVTGVATISAPIVKGRVTDFAISGASGLQLFRSITAYTITAGGAGYFTAPTITLSGGGGTGAVAPTATVAGGVITVLTQPTAIGTGTGYTTTPTVVIPPPPAAVTATATIVVASATSISVSVTNASTNGYYATVPSVSASGGVGSGAVYTAVLTNNRVTAINVTGTLINYSAGNVPTLSVAVPTTAVSATASATVSSVSASTISFPFPTTLGVTPYMVRCNNLSSPSIVHTDDGGSGISIQKGLILDSSYPFVERTENIKITLEQQTINNISLSVNNNTTTEKGIPTTTDFLYVFKLTERDPRFISFGALENNTNQQIG
jgi:hypothetical protein